MSLVSNGFIIVKFNLQYHNIKKMCFYLVISLLWYIKCCKTHFCMFFSKITSGPTPAPCLYWYIVCIYLCGSNTLLLSGTLCLGKSH